MKYHLVIKHFWSTIFLLILINFYCVSVKEYDLSIENANIFCTIKGVVLKNKTILINADTIAAIINSDQKYRSKQTIETNGKLTIPGMIDTHIHFTDAVGDYDDAPEYLVQDSLHIYRTRFSNTFLPYGITTVLGMGQPEKWIEKTLEWSKNPKPNCPDIYITGGALISKGKKKPYVGHLVVNSPEEAEKKVKEFYEMGIRYVKLYWRLRYPEFNTAIKTAQKLGMRCYGHIDQNVTFMDSTINLGLINYEHIHTLGLSSFYYKDDYKPLIKQMKKYYDNPPESAGFHAFFMEMFHYLKKNPKKIDALIDTLSKRDVTISSSIHLFAEHFGRTFFKNPLSKEFKEVNLTNSQIKRANEGFNILMGYLLKAHKKGITIRIGTDCANGGKAVLSEQLLMYEAGFSIEDIIKISTINGAKAIGFQNKYGSLEEGKKANIVVYEKSPFENYRNFLSEKTVIKDGKIFNSSNI